MIEVADLSKRFGHIRAVDHLSFTVQPGRVTGFLGPNGAGKTTTLRCALGLVSPTSGTVRFDGREYRKIATPSRHIGAALEASAFHPGRTGLGHLRWLAPAAGASTARCAEVLGFVGLEQAAGRRVGQYSLGMRARLGLAATLLGDPAVLLLDEPHNRLDPEGILWMRHLLRSLAGEGRTVLVSSHVLSEVEQTVDDCVIIARGRLAYAGALDGLRTMSAPTTVVRPASAPDLAVLARQRSWRLAAPPGRWAADPAAVMIVGPTAAEIGEACAGAGIVLHQLATQTEGLEGAFLALTEGAGLAATEAKS